MENHDNLCQYHPDVYQKDWRYGIGQMTGYNKGIRHGILLSTLSVFVVLAWMCFLEWSKPR